MADSDKRDGFESIGEWANAAVDASHGKTPIDARLTPAGLDALCVASSDVIDYGPLSFDEIMRIRANGG